MGNILIGIDKLLERHKKYMCGELDERIFLYGNLITKSLKNFDFKGKDFTLVNFCNLDLTGVSFEMSKLFRAGFVDSILIGVDFYGSDLSFALFSGAIIDDGDGNIYELSGNYVDSEWFFRSLTESQLLFLNGGSDVKPDFRHINLKNMWSCDTDEMCVEGIDVSDSSISDGMFMYGDFKNSKFCRCCINTISFHECDLPNVDFSDSELSNVSFVNCVLIGVNFHGCKLKKVYFYNSIIDDGEGNVFEIVPTQSC